MSAVRWVQVLVLLGVVLRGYHYLRGPSLWHDEAALVLNVLERDYSQMFGALSYHEAAPPLFLVVERLAVDLLGDSLLALRLIPFLCSVAALLLWVPVCRRMLPAMAVPWAVGAFAVSDRLLWHASEAKPYAVDLLLGVAVLWAALRTREWPIAPRALWGAALLPVAIWLSFPACFLAGGVVSMLALEALQRGRRRDLLALLALVASVGVSFACLAVGPAQAQRDGAMESCWVMHFPDYSRPARVPVWLTVQTLEVFRYCLLPGGQLLGGMVLLGLQRLLRQRAWGEMLLILAPWAAVVLAAMLHRYPYGGSRVVVFLLPGLFLLGGLGVEPGWRLVRNWPAARWVRLGIVLLALLPAGYTAYRVVQHWPRADCDAAARWLRERYAPGDLIQINHWEYEYYLRGLPAEPLVPHELGWQSGRRVWVVLAGGKAERDEIDRTLDRFGEPLRRAEFECAAVLEYRGD